MAKKEAEKGDAKIPLVPCIMALTVTFSHWYTQVQWNITFEDLTFSEPLPILDP